MEDKIYIEITKLIKQDTPAALATVVESSGSTPRMVGAKMLVKSDGSILGTIGGGRVELLVIEEALKIMHESSGRIIEYDLTSSKKGIGAICGGNMKVFIEPIQKQEKLFIFGAGHIAQPLAVMGKTLGLKVFVVDDRPSYANTKRFAAADKVICGKFKETIKKLPLDKKSYAVIITYSHSLDYQVLKSCLKYDLAYLGMIGSKNKVRIVFDKLKKDGISKRKLSKVFAPVGLEIGAEAPAEIAVSILAQIIKVRNKKLNKK